MTKNIRIVMASLAAILVVSLLAGLGGKGQINQQRKPSTDQIPFGQAAKEIDDAATPIVDFNNPSAGDRIDKNARKLKSARYDHGLLPSNPGPDIGEIRAEPERRAGFSDLPVSKSDVIVEAIVRDSRAFLSEDKTGIYSEFTIVLAKIFKTSSGFSANLGDTIIAERFGGKVKYPSGKIIRCRIVGEGVPIIGKRYLFFLAKADQDSYRLLTAYEIQDNQVFALDGSRTEPRGQGSSIFDRHNGEDLDSFLGKLETALNSSQVGGGKP